MIDWVMATTFLAGAACLVMAITFGGTLELCIAVAKFHPGVEEDNRLYPAHFLRRPILVNLQVQMFLVSGVVLVCCPLSYQ
jgi:hypothetical protein